MVTQGIDPFGARATLDTPEGRVRYFRLATVADQLAIDLDQLPYTVKILLENVLRYVGAEPFTEDDVRLVAAWRPGTKPAKEFPFLPLSLIHI